MFCAISNPMSSRQKHFVANLHSAIAKRSKYEYIFLNKKVLLRERKRRTARRVASACYAEGGDTPSSHGGRGVTLSSHAGGVPHPVMLGVPPPPSRPG